jgi:glutamate/tyrosine decarboxylase-like PLP-dependent enzyme
MDVAGLGRDALRLIAVDARHRIDLAALEAAIAADRAGGKRPFMLIGTAGTVDTGAIDDLAALAEVAAREGLWFHVDGAFGALAVLAPELRHRLAGIERADSIAFDFHKWLQVPYDAGFLLVRDGARHRATFAAPAAYLRRDGGGLAGGAFWPCDYGLELSRGFRALKAWFTLRVFGTERLGRAIAHTCALAQHLKALVERTPALELMAPVELNIVCFRVRVRDPDWLNARIVVRLHEAGIAAPSTTLIGGSVVIRAAIVNHRTEARDLDALVAATLEIGAELAAAPGR